MLLTKVYKGSSEIYKIYRGAVLIHDFNEIIETEPVITVTEEIIETEPVITVT